MALTKRDIFNHCGSLIGAIRDMPEVTEEETILYGIYTNIMAGLNVVYNSVNVLNAVKREMFSMQSVLPRHNIAPEHPAITFGDKYRLLRDDEHLKQGDETNCVSTLLSISPLPWVVIDKEWGNEISSMQPISQILGPDSLDADKNERLFRRKIMSELHTEDIFGH